MSSVAWLLAGVLLMAGGVRLGYAGARDLMPMGWRFALPRLGRLALSGVGMVAAALVHSSSAVSVATLAVVESGLLSTAQGLAVVLGANVGTTATAQAMSAGGAAEVTPFVLLAGLVAWAVARTRGLGRFLVGLAAIMEGARSLSGAAAGLMGPGLLAWLEETATGKALAVPFVAGWVVTAFVQSSTAVSTTAVELTARQALPPSAGVALILGANVGTVTTGLAASLVLGRRARRLAAVDLLTNLLPAAAVLAGLERFVALLRWLDPRPERMVANAHTLFNLLTLLLFLPWVHRLGRWVEQR